MGLIDSPPFNTTLITACAILNISLESTFMQSALKINAYYMHLTELFQLQKLSAALSRVHRNTFMFTQNSRNNNRVIYFNFTFSL